MFRAFVWVCAHCLRCTLLWLSSILQVFFSNKPTFKSSYRCMAELWRYIIHDSVVVLQRRLAEDTSTVPSQREQPLQQASWNLWSRIVFSTASEEKANAYPNMHCGLWRQSHSPHRLTVMQSAGVSLVMLWASLTPLGCDKWLQQAVLLTHLIIPVISLGSILK